MSIIFSEQGNMTSPGATLSHSGLIVGGLNVALDIFPYKTFGLILIFMMFTAGFEPRYVTEVQ